MAVSLQLDYTSLRREAGRSMGFSRTPANWTTSQTTDIADCLRDGLNRFYYHAYDGERIHQWSFLRPVVSLGVVKDRDVYPLGDDFAGLESPVTVANADAIAVTIRTVNESIIRQMRLTSQNFTGQPLYVAVRPARLVGSGPQRWEMVTFPTPDRAYTLQFRAMIHPPGIDDDSKYPLGGPQHAQTVVASVLAQAEKKLNDRVGLRSNEWEEQYQMCLRASIALDRQMNDPDVIGQFVDQEVVPDEEFGWEFWRTRDVIYTQGPP